MKTLKTYVLEAAASSAEVEEVKKCIEDAVKAYKGWTVDGLQFFKDDNIIVSLEDYGSKNIIWLNQPALDKNVATHAEIGDIVLSLPETDWVLVKGAYDGKRWERFKF